MPKFTNASIDRLRDAIDIVDLVSGHSDLRRAGARFSGLCPFHEERTPSFSVDPTAKLYYCFGCQEGGDAIKFVQRTENLEFPAAVEWLAERYGVQLELEDADPLEDERRRQRERLFSLLERATVFFERNLWDGAEAAAARQYLVGERGFSEDVLRRFRVGYAPSAWDKLMVAALSSGFTERELRAAGLVQRSAKNERIYDRFRGRVMFPLADTRGRVRGFGARALRESELPKYLNSADGPLYRKGSRLFGADLARGPAAKARRVIAVEGYADVLALHDAGFAEAVAIMGTALTDDQLLELARMAPSIVLALDADRAGRQAMIRAGGVADRHGVELRVVQLPPGRDPADVVRGDGGRALLAELIDRAVSVLEFEVSAVLDDADLASARGRDTALGELRPVFAGAPMGAVKEEQIRKVAGALELPESALGELRSRRPPGNPAGALGERDAPGQAPAGANSRREHSERLFMSMCLAVPDPGREYLARLDDEMLSTPLARELRDRLVENFASPLDGMADRSEELRNAIVEVVMLADSERATRQTIEIGYLQLKKAGLDRALVVAVGERKRELSMERQEVVRMLGEMSAEHV